MTCSSCPSCGAKCESDHKVSNIHYHQVKTIKTYISNAKYHRIAESGGAIVEVPCLVWCTHNWTDSKTADHGGRPR